jgi:hypothetical protein
MTNEAIEAARLRLQRVAALAVNAEEAKSAFEDIDTLCEAPRQPESLVGRRVRLRGNPQAEGYRITGERSVYRIGRFDDGGLVYTKEESAERDEFEILEDTTDA